MDDLATTPNIYIATANFFRRHALISVIIAVMLLFVGSYELGRTSVYRAYPELIGVERANAILAKIGKLIQLPAGETPTMATINDAANAKKTQPFLSSAENGDILIVYANAQEAILYRPSTDKLISVGPVNSAAPPQVSPSLTDTSPTHAATSTTKK